ncbi:MAG: cysteine hydrolase [Candidatus Eremiobacteraeota bacterium]|nr:cysteine hydrolase [Candidatus Eremiobacteraeota bacterium]
MALLQDQSTTALIVVDPYNDFISEGGKFWAGMREVAEKVNCVPNMVRVLDTARRAKLQVFYAPHHRWRPGDYSGWKYWSPIQRRNEEEHIFADGTWGGTFRDEFTPLPGEIVAQQHWCSSGFANTDLDLQLKKYGIHKIIVIGCIANTCIDSTVRFGVELGYEVTLIKDAIAAFKWEEMSATLEVNLPNYAQAIISTDELVNQLSVAAGV